MSDHALSTADRFGCTHPGCEPEGPARCEGCGETDVDKDGWCPRCNEQFGDKEDMKFDPIKTVEALSRAISAAQDGAHKVYGPTPCEAFQIHTLTLVREAIMAGIETPDGKQREDLAPLA